MRKLGIYSWFGYQMTMDERLRLISQTGFQCTSLWWGDEFEATDGEKRANARMARRLGLEISYVHLPYGDANSLWTEQGDVFERQILDGLNDCAALEIPTAVLHVTRRHNLPPVCEIGLHRLQRIVEHAERLGVELALENLQSPEYMDYLLERIPSPKLGFCFDSGHWNFFTPERDYLTQYGGRLMTVHLHDNYGDADAHMLPYDGKIHWDQVGASLGATSYRGPVLLEVRCREDDPLTPPEFLEKAYRAASRLAETTQGSSDE